MLLVKYYLVTIATKHCQNASNLKGTFLWDDPATSFPGLFPFFKFAEQI